MQSYSQNDARWKSTPLERSGLTLGSHGCLVTALTSGYSKFHPDSSLTPPKILKLLDSVISDYSGMMTMTKIEGQLAAKLGFEYKSRTWQRVDSKIAEYTRSANHFVIIEVDFNRFNKTDLDQHFIAVSGYNEKGLEIMDPIDGKFKIGLPANYAFKSFIVFEKVEKVAVVSDWAKEGVEWIKSKGVTDWSEPQSMPDNYVIAEMMHRCGLLKDGKKMTKEQLAVVLHRICTAEKD